MSEQHNHSKLEDFAIQMTHWIGSTTSLTLHTIIFIGAFVLISVGFSLEKILLILTTAVSLEAIYLSIFIQMSLNKNTRQIHEVSADIDEIQEDIEEIQEDVEDIQEDIEEIQEDETKE